MRPRSGNPTSQKGAVLVVGLVLMLVATIVALSSMGGTHMQERMTANQSQKMIAQLAAEAGGAAFSHWLLTGNDWTGTPPMPTTLTGAPNTGSYGFYYLPQPPNFNPSTGILTVQIAGVAKHPGDTSTHTLAEAALRLVFQGPIAGELRDIFGGGMFSDEDIRINGNCRLDGSGHANGALRCTSGSTTSSWHINGVLSAVGNVQHPNSVESVSNADHITIPPPNIDALRTEAGVNWEPLPRTEVGRGANRRWECNPPALSGDLEGKVYFCDGDLTVSGSHSNVVFVATGNIVYNGAGVRGEPRVNSDGVTVEPVTVGVYASGSITFNGASVAYGLFHAGGNYTHNGAGTVYGGIVAGGDITRNGVFEFTEWDEFDLSVRPPPPDLTMRALIAWQELF